MTRSIYSIFAAGAFLLLAGCGSADSNTAIEQSAQVIPAVGQSGVVDAESKPTVVQIAVGSKDHSTLVAALKAADYVDPLATVGPFTVFAPINEAFDALPKGTLENLTKKENQRQLRDILEYHVLLGVYKETDFVKGRKMGTADGRSVTIGKNEEGQVLINGAKIIGSVPASNGIIHVIDGVLLPE